MRTSSLRAAAGVTAAAVAITVLAPSAPTWAAEGDPTICSGGSLAGRFSSAELVEGTDRGTIYVAGGAQVRVVGTVENSASGAFTGPSQWNLHPFVSGVTERNTTTSVDTTWTNAGATGLIDVRMYDNSSFVNSTRFEFTFTATGPAHGSCQEPALIAPEEVLGDLSSRAYRNAACGQATATPYPVTTSTGNFWHAFDDLVIPGRGFPLALRRTYNAHPGTAVPDGPLGHGWSFTYGVSLAVGASSVVLTEEAGSRITFSGSGPTYAAPDHVTATLVGDQPSAGMLTLTRQADETLEFDAQGRLVAQRDLNGHTTTLSYLDGRLDTVADATGRTLAFAWVGSRIKTVTDANEAGQPPRVVTFHYGADDTGPDLTEVVDVTGGRTSFAYDADHRMTRMRLPNQYDPAVAVESDPEVVANVYDAEGRVVAQSDPLGRTTTFDYTTVAGSTLVTEPSTLDAAGNPVAHVRRDEYRAGLLVSQTLGYGTAEAATWTRAYDHPSLGCTRIVDPNGAEWSATYDAAGNRTSATDPLGRTTTWAYNANNLLTAAVDPRGNQPGADPVGWTTTFAYDDAGCACNLLRRSRPLLDGAGTAVVATQVVEWRYGERANHATDPTTVVDPEGKAWTTDYDAHGFPVAHADPLGNLTRVAFDAWGRKRSETTPRGNLGPAPDPAFTSEFSYDADNRLRTTTVPNPPDPAITTAADYDANRNLVSSTDADAKTTTYQLDAADQLRFVQRPDASRLETRYWDDGSVRARVDGAGAATSYFPDAQGRLRTVVDPLGRATVLGYDPAGHRTTAQHPGGNCAATPRVGCTTYGYDAAGQLGSITYSDATTPDVTDIDYAPNGARTAMVELTKASPAVTSTSTWTWDSLDRLVSSTDANGATVGYTYDRRDAIETITYPGGTDTVTRAYDDAGRWASVTDWAGNTTTFDYDADGNLTARTGPAATGVVDSFGYDHPGRLRSASVDKAATSLASFAYDRTAHGMVAKVSSTGVPADDHDFAYSALDQLCWQGAAAGACDQPPAGATRFGYDAADNLVRLGGSFQAFDAANQLCRSAPVALDCTSPAPPGTTTYAYDQRGNRTGAVAASGATTTYDYDQADRLTEVSLERPPPGAGTVAGGEAHSLALDPDGDVWAWGDNADGRLATDPPASSASPVEVVTGAEVTSVSASANHSLALRADGRVWGWGSNQAGQLGDGTGWNSRPSPVEAQGLTDVVGIAAGQWHSVAVRADGTVWSWGLNDEGQLGNGADYWTPLPAQVPGLSGVVAVAAGERHTLALGADGTVWAWGRNSSGQVGDGTGTMATAPVKVASLPDATAVGAGTSHSLAVAADGTVWGWGSNVAGQLGDGTGYNTRATPVQAQGLTGVAAVDGGLHHTLALGADGTVWAWGFNTSGQIGNGVEGWNVVPVQVPGLSGVAAVAAGHEHSLAVGADAAVWSWGRNSSGQLGDGTTTNATAPAAVPGIAFDEALSASYAYDGDGLRTAKTTGAGTTTFAWSKAEGLPYLLAEGSGPATTRYVYGPGGLPLERIGPSGEVEHYHHDQLGSTRLLTDATGAVTATYAYDPYGARSAATGASDQPFGFAGEYTDAETGFQYLRARYYDPATGQFLTRDPLEPVTGTPYAYADNSPLNFTDPSGEIPVLAAAVLAWGAFEAASAAVDAFSTAKTLTDPCASGLDKLISGGLFAFGAMAPGGGYSTGARAVKGTTRAAALADGARLHVDDALDAAEDFLGAGYRDMGNGRFLSRDGSRQVRMGDADITGKHGGGPHMNFERLRPGSSGRARIVENRHIYLEE